MALERMGASQIEILPVVSRAEVHKLEGIVTLPDVLREYGVRPHLIGLRLIGETLRSMSDIEISQQPCEFRRHPGN